MGGRMGYAVARVGGFRTRDALRCEFQTGFTLYLTQDLESLAIRGSTQTFFQCEKTLSAELGIGGAGMADVENEMTNFRGGDRPRNTVASARKSIEKICKVEVDARAEENCQPV